MVNAPHLISYNFRRGEPDAQLLAQIRIECSEEWLVEVHDRGRESLLIFRSRTRWAKPTKEFLLVHSCQRRGRNIQMGAKSQLAQSYRILDFVEQPGKERDA